MDMFKAPSQLPPLSMMLADLGIDQRLIARHLGVTERTLYAWRAAEQAPRAAMLALFWETRWGRSVADTSAFNEMQAHRAHAASLQRQNAALLAIVTQLQGLQADSANAPILDLTASVNKRV